MLNINLTVDQTIKNINSDILNMVNQLSPEDLIEVQRAVSHNLNRLAVVAEWQQRIEKAATPISLLGGSYNLAESFILTLYLAIESSGNRENLFKEGLISRYGELFMVVHEDQTLESSQPQLSADLRAALYELNLLLEHKAPAGTNKLKLTFDWFKKLSKPKQKSAEEMVTE